MNPNVKIKLDALMAEHEAKQLKLKETESKLNTEAQAIFDEIKDDVLATAYFKAKIVGRFTDMLSTLESIFAERFGYVHPKVTLKVHVLCGNMLLISGFDVNDSGNDYGVWTLKTVLSDVNEPLEPEPPTTPVGLSTKETKLYLWIAYPLAVIIITLVCTL